MKRIFALLVAFLLVFSLLPLYSLADDEATETSEPLETVVADTPTPSASPETTPEPTITPAPASESPTPEALFLHFLDCDRTDSSGSGYLEVPCLPGDQLNLEVKSESNGELTYRWQILDAESTEEDPYLDIDPQEETTADEKALAIAAEDATIGVENYYRCVVTATSADATVEQYCYFTLVNDEPIQTPISLLIESFTGLGDAANMNVPADTLVEDITFPSVLGATISGTSAEVAVTWTRSDANAAWENGGSYQFTPVLASEYLLAEGVQVPTITVFVAQADSVSISIDPMFANPGDVVTLKATISGYEGASFQWQWAAIPAEEVQEALDAREASGEEGGQGNIPQPVEGQEAAALIWNDEAGATGKEYQFTATEDNLNRYWRLEITLNDPQQFDTSVANADKVSVILTVGFPSMSTQGIEEVVGRLTIFSSDDGDYGHSWIYIENTSNSVFYIGAYPVSPLSSVSIGVTLCPGRNLGATDGDGIYYNVERFMYKEFGYYSYNTSVSLTCNITNGDLGLINQYMTPQYNYYAFNKSEFNDCSVFSSMVWNAVASDSDKIPFVKTLFPSTVSMWILGKSGQANYCKCSYTGTNGGNVYRFVSATQMIHVSYLTYIKNPADREAFVLGNSILLEWAPAIGTSLYRLQIWKPNGESTVVYLNNTTRTFTADMTGTWRWQVSLVYYDGNGVLQTYGSVERSLAVIQPTLTYTPPTLHTPVTSSYQANTDITFSWSDVGASLYKLDVYQSSSNVLSYYVGGISKTIKLSTPGTWNWKVSSMQNTATVLATSYEKTFTITPAPSGGTGTYPIPTLQSPDDAKAFDVGSNITFQWSNTGASKYKLEFICDTTPSRTFYRDISGTSYTCSFSSADNWRWQVRSYNGTTPGDAPHTRSFFINSLPPTVNRNIQASYYEGVELSVLRYQTNISSIDFNCGTGMPSGVPFYSDAFSARFKYLSDNYTEGFYKFHYEVDDAIKIWIDGDCKVDQWSSHVLNEYSSPIFILGGTHNMWIDYADMGGEAKLKVEYASCPEPKITITSPQNGSAYITGNNIPFAWNGLNLPGGSRYILEITNEQTGEVMEGIVYAGQPCVKNAPLPVGNYRWRVYMRPSVSSSKQYSSSDYGRFSVTNPPPTVPDLEPVAITSSYIDGYLYFDSGIKNNTGITSNGFNVKWYVNGVLKAYAGHNGIAGNTTAYDGNNCFYFKPSASGTYNVTYTIDVDNHIAESNESNNTATTQATIQIPAPLAVTSVKADMSAADVWDTVTWTVGTTGGVGVKQYCYKLYCGTTLVNTPVWTAQSTFKATLIDKGSYTLKAYVKDNATTLSKTSAITTVTVPLSLVSVSTSAAVVGTGTRITWTANATGGVGTKQYCYLIYKDGSLFKQTAWSTTSSYSYTPTSVGSYYAEAWVSDSIDLYYKDSVPTKAVYPFAISAIKCNDASSGTVTAGNASSPYVLTGTELTWTVTTSGGDGDVIYYYKLYNGTTLINTPEWTMQPTFTYTPTKAGTYTLKVTAKENTATVSKTSAATKVIVPLSIASITPTSTISTTGKTLSWSMKATGGAGTKYYRYVVYRDGTMIKQSSWTTSSVCSYMPTVVGVYSVNATVKDLSNSLSQDSVSTKIVLPFVIQSISCSSSYSTTGTQLAWSVTTAGGDGSIQYYYKLYKGTTLLNTPSWGTSSVFSYTPSTAGSYALRVYAKENTGTPSKASATTKVIVPLSITSMIPTSTLVTTGTSVTWAVKTAGGDGTKQYYYELYRESELIKTKSWGSLSSFAFTPTGTGTYTLKVSVKDISGSVTNEAAAVKVVLPITISGIMPSANLVARGQQITWTVSASGGDGAKQYYYKLFSGITLVNTVMWTSANSYSYTPTKAGSYTLKVYVKDNTPTVSKMSVAVKVA